MLVIGSAAHFVVCPKCRAHGTIVFADGSKSEAVGSLAEAEEVIAKSLNEKKLTEVEVPELRRQIANAAKSFKQAAALLVFEALIKDILEPQAGASADCPTEKLM